MTEHKPHSSLASVLAREAVAAAERYATFDNDIAVLARGFLDLEEQLEAAGQKMETLTEANLRLGGKLGRAVGQYQAARELLVETHDLIWNEDAAMVAGGEKLLDTLAEKIMAYLDSNPAKTPDYGHWAIRLRMFLLLRRDSRWNAWVRDFTAWLEWKT